MTEQTPADLIAASETWTPAEVHASPVGAAWIIESLAAALETAEQRAKQAEAELRDANRVDIPSLKDQRDKLAAVIENVRVIAGDHWDYQTRREAKFGREGSSCVCEVCAIMRALSTAPAEALREHDAALIEGLADEFAARLPDGTGNGRAYNSHTVARMLREKARQRREEQGRG